LSSFHFAEVLLEGAANTAALEALLSDRWVAAHPEHRLEQREEESHSVLSLIGCLEEAAASTTSQGSATAR